MTTDEKLTALLRQIDRVEYRQLELQKALIALQDQMAEVKGEETYKGGFVNSGWDSVHKLKSKA